jgi:AcrR family transcriptional regulator
MTRAVQEAGLEAKTSGSPGAQATRERILEAAEELLRRHGPNKTRVVDVARHLGMSHANVYRHFDSKADLQDLVAARWLQGISAPLEAVARQREPATKRLRCWVHRLIAIKHERFRKDPELFATYGALAEDSREVVNEHIRQLCAQLALILSDGIQQREFKVKDITRAARAVYDGITRYQHPYFVARAKRKPDDGVDAVMDLLIAGLQAGVI